MNYDCKKFIPGKKYFSDDLSQSSNHELDKNYKSDEEDYKMLCNLISTRYFFRGSLEYHYFIEVFKEVVEKRIEDPKGRLTRLVKYTTGQAKNLIKHCMQQPSTTLNGMELLESRHGHPLKILAFYQREIKKWPSIRAGDSTTFKQVTIFSSNYKSWLRNCM